MSKSYVTLEQNRCMVCGIDFDTGSLLLDRRLRDSFEHHTMTGMGLCPEHEGKFQEGYIAMVECDPKLSAIVNDVIKPGEEHRTGTLVHIRRHVFNEIFNTPAPDGPMVFVEPDVVAMLQKMMPPEDIGDEA